LTPQNALWSFGSPFGTPTLTNSQHGSSLGSVRVHSLTLFALMGACDMTPRSTYRPAHLQPPRLGRKLRLGLRHQLGSPRKKNHLDVGAAERRRVYYREYGGGILPSPGRGESCGPKCPWLIPTPKGVLECELTTWVVCLDADSHLIN